MGSLRSLALSLLLAPLLLTTAVDEESISKGERAAAFIGYSEKAGSSFKNFLITTKFGQIRIKPRSDISPKAVASIIELAMRKECKACQFYRHEPAPENFGVNGFYGPPYALLQGSMNDLAGDKPAFEGAPMVKKGDVCLIPNCKEFFIATADHDEWGNAHTVWGHVDDAESWTTINNTPLAPFTTIGPDANNITTRWLTPETKFSFELSVE